MDNHNAYIEMVGITKTFGKVIANHDINLKVEKGEIHALLGENGAGKSTLMNMLSGIYTPDKGEIYLDGQLISFSSPKDSIQAGIGMVHQHFKVIEVMTAAENVLLGQKGGLLFKKEETAKISAISEQYHLQVDLDKIVGEMSVGEKQNLEILKVLYRGARILILDEPTAVLTPQETERLFQIMRKMKENGCAVIFISHKMNEVMEITDRVTVLRKGTTVQTLNTSETNPKELTELMVGRKMDLSVVRLEQARGELAMDVKDLTVVGVYGHTKLKNVSFDLYHGEILGVAGIAGSGQKELCEAIAGLQDVKQGEIMFKGQNLAKLTPRKIIELGIHMSFVPEDRLGMGLVAGMDMVDNLLLKKYQKQKGLFIDKKPAIAQAKKITDELEIVTPGISNYPVKNLSGGNIQKVLLGRELDLSPEVLVTAYPVRGLDINTCHKIYDLLNDSKKDGVAVLFINEDLDVLIDLCDRIMVLAAGEITGIVDAHHVTKEDLGLMMLGKKIEGGEMSCSK